MNAQGNAQGAAPAKPKRKVTRSPNYPAISLEDAITKVRVVYEHERRNYTARAVILRHLGYKELRGGTGGRVLSALRQYGLLEEKDDQYRVSDLANRLLHLSADAPERAAALKESAVKPQIFRELLANYPDGLPSNATLQNYLITKKNFNPDSVGAFVRVFRATIELAKPTPGPYNAGEGHGEEEGEGMMAEGAESGRPDPRGAAAPPPMAFLLSAPRNVRAELRLTGRDLRREDIQRLKKQVSARLDELAEAFEEDAEPDEGTGDSQ